MENTEYTFKKQQEFPLVDRYKKVFPINHNTIFAYDNCIYANHELPNRILIHELVHIRQQNEMGADAWVDKFLSDEQFRLEQEIEAFKIEIESVKDGNEKLRWRMTCARKISSPLYGNIIRYEDALLKLK